MFYNTEFTQFERKIGYPHIFNLLNNNKYNIYHIFANLNVQLLTIYPIINYNMKKLLLISALMASTAMQAQNAESVTYYWPGQRAEMLTSGLQYFIYNTAFDPSSNPNDRGSFIFAQENADFGTVDPKKYANEFITSNANYVFTITNKEGNVYQIKNASGSWINFTGRPSETAVDFYIQPWATSTANKANLKAKGDDGTLTDDLNNAKVWTVTNDASNSNAWNGNGGFTTWNNAHPYAFYEIESKELDAETNNRYLELTNRTGLFSDVAFKLQQLYGLVKDGNNYYSNYPETTPAENSSYANLIDGNDNSIFHSSWSAGGEDTDPKHYLRADLGTAKTEFYFITKRRTNNNNNRPTSILIQGSNEADGDYTDITTIETGLPTEANEYFYFSDKITSKTAYRYIRFTPLSMSPVTTRFFTYSEFYIIEANDETNVAMRDIRSYYHETTRNIKDDNLVTEINAGGYDKVKQVQEDLAKTLYTNEANALLTENESNHAETPALSQYPTAAYNTLKSAIGSATTSEELATAIRTFKFSINAPVFTIDGAFSGDYVTAGKSIYYKADDNTNPLWWNKATNKYDKTMLWKFMGSTSTTAEAGQTYTVGNMSEDVYFWNVEQLQVTETNPTNTDGIILIKTQDNNTPVHAERAGYIVRWDASAPTSASAWKITYVGESFKIDQVDEAKLADYAALKALIAECEPYVEHLGDGLHQFSCEGYNFQEVLNNAKETANNDIYENPTLDVAAAKQALQNAKNALAINQPAAGKFYRIQSKTSGKFIVSYANSEEKADLTADGSGINTVFYLSADNRMTGYQRLNIKGTANFDQTGIGSDFNFAASPYLGYYTIRVKGNSSGAFYDYSGTTGKVDMWSDPNNEQCAWKLIEVTDPDMQPKLTKKMTAKYATLAAPVSLVIPEGIKAYTAQVNGQQATLSEVTGRIIPAGTAVVLQKTGTATDTDYEFNFDATSAVQNENNDLVGVYAETSVPTDTKAYILAQPEGMEIGFYILDASDRIIDANKAYLVAPAEAAGIKAFTFDFGGTTGIDNTEAATEVEEYYDLQGRRVMNPTKGIYVTKSGKKVLFY